MNLEKIMNEFVEEYMARGTYAEKEQIKVLANKMKSVIENNKDATPEEMIEFIIKDNAMLLEDIRKNMVLLVIQLL